MHISILFLLIFPLLNAYPEKVISGYTKSGWLKICRDKAIKTDVDTFKKTIRVQGFCEGVNCIKSGKKYGVQYQKCKKTRKANPYCVRKYSPFPKCCKEEICTNLTVSATTSYSTIIPTDATTATWQNNITETTIATTETAVITNNPQTVTLRTEVTEFNHEQIPTEASTINEIITTPNPMELLKNQNPHNRKQQESVNTTEIENKNNKSSFKEQFENLCAENLIKCIVLLAQYISTDQRSDEEKFPEKFIPPSKHYKTDGNILSKLVFRNKIPKIWEIYRIYNKVMQLVKRKCFASFNTCLKRFLLFLVNDEKDDKIYNRRRLIINDVFSKNFRDGIENTVTALDEANIRNKALKLLNLIEDECQKYFLTCVSLFVSFLIDDGLANKDDIGYRMFSNDENEGAERDPMSDTKVLEARRLLRSDMDNDEIFRNLQTEDNVKGRKMLKNVAPFLEDNLDEPLSRLLKSYQL